MINGLSGLRDVGGVGMAEIDVAGIDLKVADIGAARKTANGGGARGRRKHKVLTEIMYGLIPWPLVVPDVD